MQPRLIYITTRDTAEAETLARALLEKRLIACANIFPGMRSLYHWQGKIEDTGEIALICKSESRHVGEIIALVRKLHSYDTPCVVALPIEAGNPDFLQWIKTETT